MGQILVASGERGPIYIIYLEENKIDVLYEEFHQEIYELKFPPENNNYDNEDLILVGYKDSSIVFFRIKIDFMEFTE